MFEHLIEQKIQEALSQGEFENLPGSGQALQLEDESEVPPESRMAYRILKNAGYVPEEMQLRKDIKALEALLDELPAEDGDRRRQLLASINENWARYHAAIEKRRRSQL